MSILTRVAGLTRVTRVVGRRFSTAVATPTGTSTASSKASKDASPKESTNAQLRKHHVVMSISGRDEPGIVKTVSSAVAEHNANLEESRMAILGGDFAMIVYVSMEHIDDADHLASELRSNLSSFTISVRETTAPTEDQSPHGLWELTLEGPDHPGIVAAVSEALAKNGCNVQEMDTETTTAPFAGYEIFKINSKVTLDETKMTTLNQALSKLEERFGSTISLHEKTK